jgi:hypothetical protein
VQSKEPGSDFAARAKAAWARLIRKMYEADPLECPKCKGPMQVMALIEDPGVIRRILEQLGLLWTPQVSERSPPLDPRELSLARELAPYLSSVPDIACALDLARPARA